MREGGVHTISLKNTSLHKIRCGSESGYDTSLVARLECPLSGRVSCPVAGFQAPDVVMVATERITVTMRDLDRCKVVQDVVDGKLEPRRAAARPELTTRQIRRFVAPLPQPVPTPCRNALDCDRRERGDGGTGL